MSQKSTFRIPCGSCGAVLKAKPEWVGKRAECPKCGAIMQISRSGKQRPKPAVPLATERQMEYATSLGIEFPEDIDRRAMSTLIDEAVARRDEQRFERLDEIDRREGEAWEQMREQILAEIEEEDCRLSNATASQIVEELSRRGFATILTTMPWSQIEDFEDLTGVEAAISFSDDMVQKDMEATIMMFAANIMNRNSKRR